MLSRTLLQDMLLLLFLRLCCLPILHPLQCCLLALRLQFNTALLQLTPAPLTPLSTAEEHGGHLESTRIAILDTIAPMRDKKFKPRPVLV